MTAEELKKKQQEGLSLGYQESEAVKQAQSLLQQQLAQKPGAYQSPWQTQLNDTLDKILSRQEFKFDLNGEALWDTYKDQYVTQGRLAMMDTMGQAAGLTGGYGNSYAQQAGQQAYQGYLQGLNDKIPELYQLALSRYAMEGDAMNDRLALLQQQENQAYGRYQDELNSWLTERDFLQGRYDAERDYDYGRYADDRDYAYNQFINDRNFKFQQEQAALEQQRWQAEFDAAQRQYEEQMAMQSAAAAKKSGGGSSGSGSSSNSKSTVSSDWGKGISDSTSKSSGGVTGSSWALTKNNLRQNLASGNYAQADKYLDQIIDQVNESQYKEIVDLYEKYGR